MIFYIQTKDQFSNDYVEITPQPIIVDYVPESRETRSVRAISSYNAFGQWDIIILGLTVSGAYQTLVNLATPGGIWATYYDHISSSAPSNQPLATSFFSKISLSNNETAAQVREDASAFTVKWKGYITSPHLERNFSATVGGVDERMRVWIDNLVVVDQWSSLAGTSARTAGVFSFQEVDEPHFLEIEYKQPRGLGSMYNFSLQWSRVWNITHNVTFDPIPSTNLFSFLPFANSPYSATSMPSTESGKFSTVGGVELTVGTAGRGSSFAITARDLYGNLLQTCQKRHVVAIVPFAASLSANASSSSNASSGVGASASASGLGEAQFSAEQTCLASYLLTVSGGYSLNVFHASLGSLAATYYQGTDFTSPTSSPPSGVKQVNLCPGTRCPSRPQSSALQKYTPFSLRFEGLVKPENTGTYAFVAEVENADDRVKLWLDDKVIIDAWTSLHSITPSATWRFSTSEAYEDIKIVYKTTETCVYPYFCYDLKLKWQRSGTAGSPAVIPSRNLYQRTDFSRLPARTDILPSIAAANTSSAAGPGLSLNTAGLEAKFTVTARDYYGNVVDQGGALFVATSRTKAFYSQELTVDRASTVESDLFVTTPQILATYPMALNLTRAGDQDVHVQSSAAGGVQAFVYDNNMFLDSPFKSFVSPRLELKSTDLTAPRAFSVRWSGFLRARANLDAGLWATYYSSDCTTNLSNASYPVEAEPFYYMDFEDSIDGLYHAPVCSNASYKIKWAGFIRPELAQTYTIYAARQTSEERLKVWIENSLVIDAWSSLSAATEISGTVDFASPGAYYEVRIDYTGGRRGAGVKLTWETLSQPKEMLSSRLFSGSEKPAQALEYLFKAYPETGCKVTIGANAVVVNTLDAPEAMPYSSILLKPDTWYSIEMVYADVQDAWAANLSWAFPGKGYDAIPSTHLMYPLAHIQGSPFFAAVVAQRASAEHSHFSPPQFHQDVGKDFTMEAHALDRYGNQVVTGAEQFLGLISYAADSYFSASQGRIIEREATTLVKELLSASHNIYKQKAVVTRAGSAALSVRLLRAAGIAATYFSDQQLDASRAVKSTVVASIDFSAPAMGSPPATSLPESSPFSIRWRGMLRPSAAQTHTMFADRKAAHERFKMWVDNELLIDMWRSLDDATEVSATVNFDSSGGYYDIRVEYASGHVANASKSSNPTAHRRGLQVSWASSNLSATNLSRSVINGTEFVDALFVKQSSTQHDALYSFPVEFYPTDCIVSSSSARGGGISIATVGERAFFTVVSRDMYGNEMQPDYTRHALRVHGSAKVPAAGDIVWNGSEYHASYRATIAGYTSLSVQVQCAGNFEEIPLSPFNVSVRQAAAFDAASSSITSSSITIITAGIPATFNILLRDEFGSEWYSKKAALAASFAGDGVFHYQSAVLNEGTVISVESSSSFFLFDDFSDDLDISQSSGGYEGLIIAVGAESRLISSYTVSSPHAYPRVTLSKPFSRPPPLGTRYVVSGATDPNPAVANERIDLAMTYTSSGTYVMTVRQALGEGLEGTYFLGEFEAKIFSQIDSTVNFEWSTLTPMVPFYKEVDDGNVQFTARWTGFVYSSLAQEHSFYVNLPDTDDRVRLWIDSNVVLDAWSSLSGAIKPLALDDNCRDREGQIEICRCACNETTVTCYSTTTCWTGSCSCRRSIEPSGAAVLLPWMMHSVVLEYKNTARSSGIALQWSTNGVGGNIQQQIIPKTFLRPHSVHLQGSPLEVRVVPGEVSVRQSSAALQTSILTAGTSQTFEVVARDTFGNIRDFDPRRSQLLARFIYDPAPVPRHNAGVRIPAVHAVMSRNAKTLRGEYTFAVTPTVAGASVPLVTSLATAGGISATYYRHADLRPSAAAKAAILPTVDFSSARFSAPPESSLPSNSSYSIRWAGMLRPIHAATYTFFADRKVESVPSVTGLPMPVAEERVKVWVDNVLLIDMWSSLWGPSQFSGTYNLGVAGEYYDLRVEYQNIQYDQVAEDQGMRLRWASPFQNISEVPESTLYQEKTIGEPDRVFVNPSVVCRATSLVSGVCRGGRGGSK